MSSHIGQQLGNYRLIRLLGRGGFADVYLAEHIYLKTHAAVKILNTQLTREDLQSFLKEAQTIARLKHLHIIRILDFGVDSAREDAPYLVMDYAPGGTLRQRHPKGSIVPLATIVSYVIQAATALQYIHDEKLIHCDVKPENMLLGSGIEVLLSDFGIASIAHSTSSLKTQAYSGTVHYSAPEQLQGKARPASDQYALGIVVYEWLTGTRPFTGSSHIEIAMQHISAPPTPLHTKVPTISSAVEQVVMRALEKDPQDRFESVMAFARALEDIAKNSQTPSSLVPVLHLYTSSHTEKLYWLPNDKLLAVIDKNNTIRVFNTETAKQTLSAKSNYFLPLDWSPEGKHLVIKDKEDESYYGYTYLILNPTTGKHILNLEHCDSSLYWSSDDRLLVIRKEERNLQIMDVENHRQLLSIEDVSTINRSHDHKYLLLIPSRGAKYRMIDLSQGREVWTYESEQTGEEDQRWSEDDKYLAIRNRDNIIHFFDATTGREVWAYKSNFQAYLSAFCHTFCVINERQKSMGATTFYALNISRKEVVESFIGYHFSESSPDGRFIQISNIGTATMHIFDCLTSERSDLKGVWGFPEGVGYHPWSPNGRYYFVNRASDPLHSSGQVFDLLKKSIVWRGGAIYTCSWSPDSTYLAGFIEGRLYVIDPTKGKETKISEDQYIVDEDTYLHWLPGSKYIQVENQVFDYFGRKLLLSLPSRIKSWSRKGDKLAVAIDNEIIIYQFM